MFIDSRDLRRAMIHIFIDHLYKGYKAINLAVEDWLGFSPITELTIQDGSLTVQYSGLDRLCKVLDIIPRTQDHVIDESGKVYINEPYHPPKILIYNDDDHFYPDQRIYTCRGNKHVYQIDLEYFRQDFRNAKEQSINSLRWTLRLSFLEAKPKPVNNWSDPILSILMDTRKSHGIGSTDTVSVHMTQKSGQLYDKSLLYNQVDPKLRHTILQTIHNKIRSAQNTTSEYHTWLKNIEEYTSELNIPNLYNKLEAINESLQVSQEWAWWMGSSKSVKGDYKSIRMYRDRDVHGSWFFVLPTDSIWLYRSLSEITQCYLPLAELQLSFSRL